MCVIGAYTIGKWEEKTGVTLVFDLLNSSCLSLRSWIALFGVTVMSCCYGELGWNFEVSYINIKIIVLFELCSSRIKCFMFNCFIVVIIYIIETNIVKIVLVHRLYNKVNTQGSFFKPQAVQ